jgi:hypothetical protein
MLFSVWIKFLGVMLVSGAAFAQDAGENKVVGQIGLIEGRVMIDSKPVKKGAKVREGSVIEVMKDGRATLILGTGTVFNLSSESRMVVKEYGLAAGSGEEKAGLELSYGRTRGLILNKGTRRDIRIRARSATMGVRGTEVFIDVPKDDARPVQFFTLEGKADVFSVPGVQPVSLGQNQGVAHAPSKPDSAPAAGAPAALSSGEVKEAIQQSGLEKIQVRGPLPPPPPPGGPRQGPGAPGTFAGMNPGGGMVPFPFDPIQDKVVPLGIIPNFCNATSANCP